jgi:hypothetical protein
MEDHDCKENVWWLDSEVGKEGNSHGKVVVRGACAICDRDIYAIAGADELDKKTGEELSGEEEKLTSA